MSYFQQLAPNKPQFPRGPLRLRATKKNFQFTIVCYMGSLQQQKGMASTGRRLNRMAVLAWGNAGGGG
jgi:hypothetical protein